MRATHCVILSYIQHRIYHAASGLQIYLYTLFLRVLYMLTTSYVCIHMIVILKFDFRPDHITFVFNIYMIGMD